MGKVSEIIDARLLELGIKGSKMCDDLGISRSTLTELRKGRATTLKAERAVRIAEYLGISVERLLGNEEKENPVAKSDEVTFDDFTYALHNQSKELNDANKAKLLDMARMLKLAQDAQKNK